MPVVESENQRAAFAGRVGRARIERLGWAESEPDPVEMNTGVVPVAHRLRLRRSPVLLTPLGWPQGAQVKRLPDFAWRFTLLCDRRQDHERPEPIRPAPLFPEDTANPNRDVENTLDGYRRAVRRHAEMLRKANPRLLLFSPNIGVVSFTGERGTNLALRHELLAIQPDVLTAQSAEACLVHIARLEPEAETPPTPPREPQPVPAIIPEDTA